MPRVYITGDKHGDYKEVEAFCLKWNTCKDDLLIVLGDNGVNYYGPKSDRRIKRRLSSLPITFFMIRGNHDQRPSKKLYTLAPEDVHPLVKGPCLWQEEYPNLLFAAEYGEYQFMVNGRWVKSFVIGGAYSVDKWYRMEMLAQGFSGYRWFYDEQLYDHEMKDAADMIADSQPEIILSHTCPLKYIPYDSFLSQIDQSTVDQTMEKWMDEIEDQTDYRKWYCGHYHTDRNVDNVRIMFHDIIELE